MREIAAARSRISPFVLHRPQSVDEACELLARHSGDIAIHAGGLNIVNRMKEGYRIGHLMHLGGIAELREASISNGFISIGAIVTHHKAANAALLRSRMPRVSHYLEGLGNVRVRMQGTLGGNLLARQPGYEILPLLIVLEAELEFAELASTKRTRFAARSFLPMSPPEGLLTRIILPVGDQILGWDRQLRPDLSLVMCLNNSATGHTGIAAFLGGATGPVVVRFDLTEDIATGAAGQQQEIRQMICAAPPPPSVDPAYFQHAAGVLFRRCVGRLTADLPGGVPK